MNILILDEQKPRRVELADVLGKNKHKVTCCSTSNEFNANLDRSTYDMLLCDVESWRRGHAIYNYFNTQRKLEKMSILFYNADERFSGLPDRARNEKDQIVPAGTAVESIAKLVP